MPNFLWVVDLTGATTCAPKLLTVINDIEQLYEKLDGVKSHQGIRSTSSQEEADLQIAYRWDQTVQ